MFLVCVYNVSPDQPYTIFKAPTTSTAQDIITQVDINFKPVVSHLLHSVLGNPCFCYSKYYSIFTEKESAKY